MIKLIIEKELREIIGSKKFVLTFVVCASLIVLAFYMGAQNYKLYAARYEAAQAENFRQLEALTDWLMVNNYRVFLPPQPLEALVMGISNDIGRTINVYGRGELSAIDSRYNDDPLFAVFRFLDLHFIFSIVLSLFAILLTFDAINGEKERGTLKLSFSNAIPREKYIIAKIAGSFLGLVIPLLIPILIGFLILIALQVHLNTAEWMRLGAVIITGVLYFSVWLTLAVFVSTVTQKSSNSFLALLVIWIFFVFIIPRTSVLLAGRAVDVPSVDQLSYQKGMYAAQLSKEDRNKIAQFNPSVSDDPPKMAEEFQKFMQELGDERERKMNAFASRLNEDRRNKQQRQQLFAFALARVSPGALFSLITTDLVSTSLELPQHFVHEAIAYQQQYRQFIKEKTGIVLDRGSMMMRVDASGQNEDKKMIDPHELPAFEYKSISLKKAFTDSMFNWGLLLLFNIVFFTAAFTGFIKYDVR